MNNFDYKNMTPFKWFVLENFPFIENDFDAINNYHLFSKVVEYLNKTIDNVNELGQLVEEFSNYFDNLDVQQEINNKLDEMAEDGTLTLLIQKYVDPIYKKYEETINTQITNQNANIENINLKVNSLSSGSPAGVFSTLEDLKNNNPDHNKIYIVSSDGNWYYWNSNDWVSGGVYQATEIDENDEVIVDLKLRDNARFNSLLKDVDIEIYKGPAESAQIDASTGIYSTTVDGNLQACKRFVPLEIGKTYNVTRLNGGPMYNIYYYDTNKNYIKSEWPNSGMQTTPVTFTNTEYGYIRFGSWKDGNSSATLETKVILKEILSFIPLVKQTKGHITSFNTINIDTVNKKLITGPTTYINVGNNLQYNIGNKEYTITDIITNGGWCYYHPDTDTIDITPSDNAIFIGAIWQNGSKIDLFMNTGSTLLVNGLPYKLDSEYSNKKVLCLGDSMTAGVGTTTIYYDYLKILLGKITPYAYGVGGSSITPKQGDYPSWDTAQSFLERYNNMQNDGDVIIVFGGVNDWVTGRNLGNINSTDTYTFYGAMKSLCEGLITKYPNKQIVFFTSPQNDYVNRTASIPSDSEYYGNTDGYNRQGLKLQDYTKAMVEVCDIYGIPCERLDTKCWYGLSGLLGDGTLGSDNLHPNANGHKIIAKNMASFIKNNR